MAVHRIAVIGGDGIGPEVIEHAIRAADAAARKHDKAELSWDKLPWSTAYYKQHGRMLPENGWDCSSPTTRSCSGPSARRTCRTSDGASAPAPDAPRLRPVREPAAGLLIRRRAVPDCWQEAGDIDMLVYRENTEGEYARWAGTCTPATENEIAVQTGVFTRRGCERILRAAFDAARHRPRKTLTSITKSNAQVYGMGLWDDVFNAVRKDYPDVKSSSLLVDAAAMDFVRKPETFDVVVASNLFGDILTDLSAAVTGSIGLASSANIKPDEEFPSMFEPVHGSARTSPERHREPDGRDPLRWADAESPGPGGERDGCARRRGEGAERRRGEDPDLGGTATTTQIGDAVGGGVGREGLRAGARGCEPAEGLRKASTPRYSRTPFQGDNSLRDPNGVTGNSEGWRLCATLGRCSSIAGTSPLAFARRRVLMGAFAPRSTVPRDRPLPRV